MKHNAGYGVHHGGEGGDGQNVAGDFYGTFFGRALDFLNAFRMGHRADVPDVAENFTGVGNEHRGEFAIVSPGTNDGGFVDAARGFVEEERSLRDVRVRLI